MIVKKIAHIWYSHIILIYTICLFKKAFDNDYITRLYNNYNSY